MHEPSGSPPVRQPGVYLNRWYLNRWYLDRWYLTQWNPIHHTRFSLNTTHVLRLSKANVLALNKAHVLRPNNKIYAKFRANTKKHKGGRAAEGRAPPFVEAAEGRLFVLALNFAHILRRAALLFCSVFFLVKCFF